MTRTHENVRYTPKGEPYTPISAAQGVEDALKVLEGRWKLIILFHLFGGKVLRFSDADAKKYLEIARDAGWEAVIKASPEHGPKLREYFTKKN